MKSDNLFLNNKNYKLYKSCNLLLIYKFKVYYYK